MDKHLLDILVDPVTKGPLIYDSKRQELLSRAARLAYPIRDGIPVMLPEEARFLQDNPRRHWAGELKLKLMRRVFAYQFRKELRQAETRMAARRSAA